VTGGINRKITGQDQSGQKWETLSKKIAKSKKDWGHDSNSRMLAL
jgi:hypothetical protein